MLQVLPLSTHYARRRPRIELGSGTNEDEYDKSLRNCHCAVLLLANCFQPYNVKSSYIPNTDSKNAVYQQKSFRKNFRTHNFI